MTIACHLLCRLPHFLIAFIILDFFYYYISFSHCRTTHLPEKKDSVLRGLLGKIAKGDHVTRIAVTVINGSWWLSASVVIVWGHCSGHFIKRRDQLEAIFFSSAVITSVAERIVVSRGLLVQPTGLLAGGCGNGRLKPTKTREASIECQSVSSNTQVSK